MVVANTTASIFEINERRSTPICQFTKETVGVILAAIASCSDWCQTILYNGLAHYVPVDSADADILIERFTPFLKHNNPAVVIGSFRCIFSWIAHSSKDTGTLFPQIIPPFLTLVTSASPEVQYVVLRALSLFCQKYPRALAKEIKTFFCKYNDPSYVKLEKLDVIVTICGPQNAQLVLDELAEYANGVDVGFVRKAIKSIGQIAVKIEAASRRAVDILVQLVTGKASYAVEESVIVVADILRKYPGSFESILQTVCQNFETLKEPRAKAAGIWMLGEYCDLIEHADVLLDPFLDTFHDEQPQVQLQILASLVKLYIDKPDETRDQLQFVLNEATKDTNVPDVKNRALIYWRILSADAQVAKDIVLFGKQTVMHSGDNFEDAILDELISNMGTVAGVLHVVPADFVSRVRFSADDEDDEVLNEGVLRSWRQIALNDDSFLELFIDYDQANLHFRIVNKSPTAIGQFAIAINKNPIGLAIAEQPTFPSSLEFGDVAEVKVPFLFQPGAVGNLEVSDLQIALKTSAGLVFGTARIPVEFATVDGGKISNDRFRELSGSLPVAITVQVDDVKLADESQLTARKIFVVGKAEDKLYVAFQIASGAPFIAEIAQKGRDIVASVKGPDRTTLTLVQQGAQALFGAK
jgi:hypothetical protein